VIKLILQTTVKFFKNVFYIICITICIILLYILLCLFLYIILYNKIRENRFGKYFIKLFFFIFVFIYLGLWHFLHKTIFEAFGFDFIFFDFDTPSGIRSFYVALLDFEHLLLAIYIIFFKIGITTFSFMNPFSTTLFNFNWLVFFVQYWDTGITPSQYLSKSLLMYIISRLS